MNKKLLALLLVLAVMVSSVILVSAADTLTTSTVATSESAETDETTEEEKLPFNDLSKDHLNYEAIKYLFEQKVINGYEDGTFQAENVVTRAEFTKMLIEIAGYANIYGGAGAIATGFPDVDAAEGKEAHWAANYIRIAVEQKIINGYDDGTFRPEHPVKFEEATKMLVCYLGREVEAIDLVTIDQIPLWPDAYLKVGAKHSLSKNAASSVGVNISRAIVAQMMYNMKDVNKIVTIPNSGNVFNGGGSFGGGGSSSKGDGQTTKDKWAALEKGQRVNGLSVSGTVVGTVEILKNGDKNYFFTDHNAERSLTKNQIVVKTTKEIQGTKYIVFEGDEGNNSYLGHNVKVTFNFDDDVFTATEIKSESYSIRIKSEDIDIERSLAKTESEGENTIVYWKGDKRESFVLPDDFADKFIVYNNKFVDNFAYRQMLEAGGNPVPEEPEQTVEFEDFLPKSGSVKIVGESEYELKQGNVQLIRAESYETYVAKGSPVTSGDAKVLTDKYRKDSDENPVKLTLYEDGKKVGYQLEMEYSKKTLSTIKLTLNNIKANTVLDIAQSLCGKYTKIIITQSDPEFSNLNIVEDRGDEIDLGSIRDYKTYEASTYYTDYVYPTIQEEIEKDKTYTPYFNKDGKIAWAKIAEAQLDIAYLKFSYALQNTINENMEVVLVTKDTTATKYIITEQTKFNGKRCKDLTDDEGRSGVEYVENALKQAASVINSPKPEKASGATHSQPIRYAVSGSTLTHIETVEPDTEKLVTSSSEPLYYSSSDRVFHDTVDDIYKLSSDSTLIMVPNHRTAWSGKAYAIGKYTNSFVTAKLKDNFKYLIEPYFITTESGAKERKLFVIYYEDTFKKPDYFSNNAVVGSITPGAEHASITTKAPYSGTYSVYSSAANPKGYVLDSNYNRIEAEGGGYVQREVKVGDVIRFSMTPDENYIYTIEIVFDISEDILARKSSVFDKYGEEHELAFGRDIRPNVAYFGRVGIVKTVPSEDDADGKISMILQDGADYGEGKTTSVLDAAKTTSVISYDHTLEDKNNKFNTSSSSVIRTLADVHEGDMIMAVYNYTNKSTPQFVYVVRYEENMLDKYDAQNQEPEDE